MKALVLFLSFHLICLPAVAEVSSLELVAGKEETQVFLINARRLQADSSSFRLTGADGTDIPFSFDLRYAPPADADRQFFNGRFVPKPNGYHSKWSAPASESRFTHPGWLSFRKQAGVERYTLTYTAGTPDAVRPRPNPAVRPWWIELMHDPQLHDTGYLSFRAGTLTQLPDGGVEISRSFRWNADAYVADPRLKGRRLIALLRSAGLDGYFSVPFYNPLISKTNAINGYFKSLPGAPTDLCVEGRVADRPGDLFRSPHGSMNARPVQEAGQVYALYLQSPPEEIPITVKLNSSLYHLGDRLRITTDGLGYELLHPVTPDIARMERWEPEEALITAALKKHNGKTVKTFTGHECRLEGVPSGKYHLEVTLQSRRSIPETIATERFAVEIQDGPGW